MKIIIIVWYDMPLQISVTVSDSTYFQISKTTTLCFFGMVYRPMLKNK